MVVRTYQDELKYLEKISNCCWRIKKGFVDNMNVRYFIWLFFFHTTNKNTKYPIVCRTVNLGYIWNPYKFFIIVFLALKLHAMLNGILPDSSKTWTEYIKFHGTLIKYKNTRLNKQSTSGFFLMWFRHILTGSDF